MKLAKDDTIVTAFGESASGPGWANNPIIVIVRSREGALRQEWIQPDVQTNEMSILYNVSQAAHRAMVKAIMRRYQKEA